MQLQDPFSLSRDTSSSSTSNTTLSFASVMSCNNGSRPDVNTSAAKETRKAFLVPFGARRTLLKIAGFHYRGRSHSAMRVVQTLSLFRKRNSLLQSENSSFSLLSALRVGACKWRLYQASQQYRSPRADALVHSACLAGPASSGRRHVRRSAGRPKASAR